MTGGREVPIFDGTAAIDHEDDGPPRPHPITPTSAAHSIVDDLTAEWRAALRIAERWAAPYRRPSDRPLGFAAAWYIGHRDPAVNRFMYLATGLIQTRWHL